MVADELYTVGLIPAHAGKTRGNGAGTRWFRAHPRSRGENVQGRSTALMGVGSSPLTRGKRLRATAGNATCGLIPAHAGKTSLPALSAYGVGAHPRSRGENPKVPEVDSLSPGSSPLTRGKLERRSRPNASSGLIPAHAGKTALVMPSSESA